MTISEKTLPKKAESSAKPVPPSIAAIQSFSGPAPHPNILREYEQLLFCYNFITT
jgi:hypothetical protein